MSLHLFCFNLKTSICVFKMENQQGPSVQHKELCSTLWNDLMVTRGKDGGRDSQGVWSGHGHTAVFNMENQQGPAGQHRELCSILCNNLMVTRGEGWVNR